MFQKVWISNTQLQQVMTTMHWENKNTWWFVFRPVCNTCNIICIYSYSGLISTDWFEEAPACRQAGYFHTKLWEAVVSQEDPRGFPLSLGPVYLILSLSDPDAQTFHQPPLHGDAFVQVFLTSRCFSLWLGQHRDYYLASTWRDKTKDSVRFPKTLGDYLLWQYCLFCIINICKEHLYFYFILHVGKTLFNKITMSSA